MTSLYNRIDMRTKQYVKLFLCMNDNKNTVATFDETLEFHILPS